MVYCSETNLTVYLPFVAPVTTPTGDVTMYWHTYEYTSTSLHQGEKLNNKQDYHLLNFSLNLYRCMNERITT